MATYKVSYKMLAKQGEELKAVAKLIEGYGERVAQISGKLGDNETLASVRNNLSKFREQLTESRTVLSVAGGLLTGTVEKYTAVETRQVKNVDSYKAHNRDFYKNPVVVASAGAGAGGAAVAAASPAGAAPSAPAQTTVNYTENTTVTNNYTQVNVTEAAPVAAAPVDVAASPIDTQTAAPIDIQSTAPLDTQSVAPVDISAPPVSAPAAAPVSAPAPAVAPAAAPVAAAPTPAVASGPAPVAAAVAPASAAPPDLGKVAGIAGVGLAGAALGAGGALGAKHLADKKKAGNEKTTPEKAEAADEYDPEKELAAALERVRQLSEEE
jgi:hypothetical protein